MHKIASFEAHHNKDSRPIVDLLIGIDYLGLHCSFRDARGQEREPIA